MLPRPQANRRRCRICRAAREPARPRSCRGPQCAAAPPAARHRSVSPHLRQAAARAGAPPPASPKSPCRGLSLRILLPLTAVAAHSMTFKGKRILLGITGGIAAYKPAELARLLIKEGADVRVAMTEAATRFITSVTMQALSAQPVWTDLWDGRVADNMGHIELSRDRDLIVVAPASADFMAKLAHGLADDLLSSVCLARRCPLLLAPAMNVEMWENRATQRNLEMLYEDDILFAGPTAGDQACGETGLGRMLEPAGIVDEIEVFFQPKRLAGKHGLIPAGPPPEPGEPVPGPPTPAPGRMGDVLSRGP